MDDQFVALLDQYVTEVELARKTDSYSHAWEIADTITTKYMVEKFPALYGNVRLGISIGPGWIPIMVELGEKIEAVKALLSDSINVEFIQIKEKFGGLRAYYDIECEDEKARETIEAAVRAAEARAEKTCEVCGEPGEVKQSKSGWLTNSCEKHNQ
jgi:hypothetical protein